MFITSTLLALAPLQTTSVEAPFVASERPPAPGQVELRIDLGAVERGGDRPIWAGLPLPDGSVVDLELVRDSWRSVVGPPVVDGELRRDLWESLDLTVWRGTVVGDPDSVVRLGVSDSGVNGHLLLGGRTYVVEQRRGVDGDFGGGHFAVRDLADGVGGLFGLGGGCGTDERPADPARGAAGDGPPGGTAESYAAAAGFQVRVAVSCDYWVFDAIGSLAAEIAYVDQLLWSVSDLYRGETAALMTFPFVEFWTTPNDPFDFPDIAPDEPTLAFTELVLTEYELQYAGIIAQQGVHLGMLLTGENIGGGMASAVGGICDGASVEGRFNVCGGIVGGQPFPIGGSVGGWEFFVLAHELGHNLGAPHTHAQGIDACADYDPENAPEDTSMCQTGTIMSYCHVCPDGTDNVLAEFHPINVANIAANLILGCHTIQCAGPVYASQGLGLAGMPNGSPAFPYHSVLEAARVASLCGEAPGVVYVEGGFPGAVELNELAISLAPVELRAWPGTGGATVGQ